MQNRLKVMLSESSTNAVYEIAELRNTTAPRLVNEAVGLLIEAHLAANRTALKDGTKMPKGKSP